MKNTKLMRIGDENLTIQFWLGKLEVGLISKTISYGVSYIPKLKQNRTVSIWLYMAGKGDSTSHRSVDEALKKFKSSCGEGFSVLRRTERETSDVLEKEITTRLTWGTI